MNDDRRWTLLELERTSGIEKRTVHEILRNKLHLRKIAARWVPHAMTKFKGGCAMQYAPTTLAYEPKLKRQSTEWRHAGSPKRQKPFPVKLIVIVAYDVRSVIVCNFVPHGRTVTAQYYRDFLVRQVRHGVRDKRPDLVDSAIIQHDNTRPHKAECVRQLLRRRGWEELEHPPVLSRHFAL
ncbi:histone-lysine N-methyltransferase SETMAR [Trichonephila clavipes]|nr:histone-lysine N-methyltransferase SETMAR [Trichonephila clavipes]